MDGEKQRLEKESKCRTKENDRKMSSHQTETSEKKREREKKRDIRSIATFVFVINNKTFYGNCLVFLFAHLAYLKHEILNCGRRTCIDEMRQREGESRRETESTDNNKKNLTSSFFFAGREQQKSIELNQNWKFESKYLFSNRKQDLPIEMRSIARNFSWIYNYRMAAACVLIAAAKEDAYKYIQTETKSPPQLNRNVTINLLTATK